MQDNSHVAGRVLPAVLTIVFGVSMAAVLYLRMDYHGTPVTMSTWTSPASSQDNVVQQWHMAAHTRPSALRGQLATSNSSSPTSLPTEQLPAPGGEPPSPPVLPPAASPPTPPPSSSPPEPPPMPPPTLPPIPPPMAPPPASPLPPPSPVLTPPPPPISPPPATPPQPSSVSPPLPSPPMPPPSSTSPSPPSSPVQIPGTLGPSSSADLMPKPQAGMGLARRHIYAFWTGTKPMGQQRAGALANMLANLTGNVVLVTPSNLTDFVVPEHPLHPAYPHLHLTHKADYLRTYFMHHYGGGYSDIKYYPAGNNYGAVFDHLASNNSCWGVGYQELGPGTVAPNANSTVKDAWQLLVGNGAYVFRPKTPLTTEWLRQAHALLDSKLEALIKAKAGDTSRAIGIEYPIGWTNLLGNIFHLVNYEYRYQVQGWLQPPSMGGYRDTGT